MKRTPNPLISIVDDDESVRQALKSLIDSVGFRAQVFGSGEEFLNSAYVLQTDCLIADAGNEWARTSGSAERRWFSHSDCFHLGP